MMENGKIINFMGWEHLAIHMVKSFPAAGNIINLKVNKKIRDINELTCKGDSVISIFNTHLLNKKL
jgi:hypothetical protein